MFYILLERREPREPTSIQLITKKYTTQVLLLSFWLPPRENWDCSISESHEVNIFEALKRREMIPYHAFIVVKFFFFEMERDRASYVPVSHAIFSWLSLYL